MKSSEKHIIDIILITFFTMGHKFSSGKGPLSRSKVFGNASWSEAENPNL